jgi:hypothetical protein
VEADFVDGRELVSELILELIGRFGKPASAVEKLEVVIGFVGGNFAGFGHGDGPSEEERAAIAGVADALGDASAPDKPGGGESVLEEDGHVEVEFAEAFDWVGNVFEGKDAVGEGLIFVNAGDGAAGEDGNFGLGLAAADGLEGGHGHDGVADPICGADEDFHVFLAE